MTTLKGIKGLLGDDADSLLTHKCKTIPKKRLHLPGPNFIDRVLKDSDRNPQILRNLQSIYDHGRLGGSGYLSILPVDQDLEHDVSTFAKNTRYLDPENIVQLAIAGGCNAVVSSLEALGKCSRKYAHKIPFIAKINHNELLTYPADPKQILFGSPQRAWDLGATAVGATIYFGSQDSKREISEIAEVFQEAHSLGMPTVLWCYLRNPKFKRHSDDFHSAADLTGQANRIGVTVGADIVKQKLPTTDSGYSSICFGKPDENLKKMTGTTPIDWCRYQVAAAYGGRVGLINSGGGSKGAGDLEDVTRTAVINKRAGGHGLISGRKAFQKSLKKGVEILNTIQDVYLEKEITIA